MAAFIVAVACIVVKVSGFIPTSISCNRLPTQDFLSYSSYAQKVVANYAITSSSSSSQLRASSSTEEAAAVLSSTTDNDSSSSPSSSSSATTKAAIPSDWQTQILSALSVVMDPDLNTDIVSLGFVQNLQIDTTTSRVSFDLELTTPACPVKELFVQQCTNIINEKFSDWTNANGGVDITLSAQPTPAPEDAAPGTPLGMAQIGAVIAVSSCKGGVGKSTTSVNLAYALSKLGAKVGIFDADVYGPSLPTMVTPTDDTVRFVGRQITPLQRDNVSLMSFGYVNEGSAVMRGPMVTQLLDQFLSLTNWGALDYLILDMPPGTGDIQLTLSQRLNITAAVIVTTPQELSFVDVERGVEMFDTVNVPCVAVVENMAYLEKEKDEISINEDVLKEQFRKVLLEEEEGSKWLPNGDGSGGDDTDTDRLVNNLVKIVQANVVQGKDEDTEKDKIRIFGPGHKHRLSEQWGIEHTYSIPLLGQIAKNGDSGTPFILENPDSPQAEIYYQLAKSVVSEVAKTKFGKGKGVGRPDITYDSELHTIQVMENQDDNESTINPVELRRECRCAACVEELTGRQLLDVQSVSASIKPLSMSPTGNYALSVDWSDGHRSLYPYRQIRSLIAAKKEKE